MSLLYDVFTLYQGKEANSEVTICLKNAKAWNDRKKGRIVQTNLVMINTGSAGVCNVTGRHTRQRKRGLEWLYERVCMGAVLVRLCVCLSGPDASLVSVCDCTKSGDRQPGQ